MLLFGFYYRQRGSTTAFHKRTETGIFKESFHEKE